MLEDDVARVSREALLREIADLQEASEIKFKRPTYQKHLDCVIKLDFIFQIRTRRLPYASMKDLANLTHIAYTIVCT
jgi:hypothetical protein